jgi:hypothetical protein
MIAYWNRNKRNSKGFSREACIRGGKTRQANLARERRETPIGPRPTIPKGRLTHVLTDYDVRTDIFQRYDVYESLKSRDKISVVINRRQMLKDISWTKLEDMRRRSLCWRPEICEE